MVGEKEKRKRKETTPGNPHAYKHHFLSQVFLTLGELGPGNNIGLMAAKTCATGIRGQYYGAAAAAGKVGAFVGTWVFPYIQAAGGAGPQSAQYPFYVSSSLCLLSGALALLCLPHVAQDTIAREDAAFRAFLESRGWDTRQLGLRRPSLAGSALEGLEVGGGGDGGGGPTAAAAAAAAASGTRTSSTGNTNEKKE